MVDIQCAAAEIRRGKKKRRKIEINYRMKILWSALFHRATITNHSVKIYMVCPITEGDHNDMQRFSAPCVGRGFLDGHMNDGSPRMFRRMEAIAEFPCSHGDFAGTRRRWKNLTEYRGNVALFGFYSAHEMNLPTT